MALHITAILIVLIPRVFCFHAEQLSVSPSGAPVLKEGSRRGIWDTSNSFSGPQPVMSSFFVMWAFRLVSSFPLTGSLDTHLAPPSLSLIPSVLSILADEMASLGGKFSFDSCRGILALMDVSFQAEAINFPSAAHPFLELWLSWASQCKNLQVNISLIPQ